MSYSEAMAKHYQDKESKGGIKVKYSEDEKKIKYDTYYRMGYECGSIDAEHDLFGYHFDMSNKNVGEELWDGYHDDMINAFYDGYSQAQDEYRTYKKDNYLGGLVMTFSEAMQALLKGKKVRRVKWAIKEDYITLATSGYIVCNDSTQFNPNTDDIKGDWEEYYDLKPGSRFVRDGKIYRLVSASSSCWGLLDVDDWCIVYRNLTSDYLVDRIRNGALEKLD